MQHDMHRHCTDIKPSNILCNSAGAIKLCDFNVAGIQAGSVNKTYIGTSLYMAPERVKAQRYNIKADVWSLGITLVELAHGRAPYVDPATKQTCVPMYSRRRLSSTGKHP
jgi:mitogen-activated protein kinase kinase